VSIRNPTLLKARRKRRRPRPSRGALVQEGLFAAAATASDSFHRQRDAPGARRAHPVVGDRLPGDAPVVRKYGPSDAGLPWVHQAGKARCGSAGLSEQSAVSHHMLI